MVVERERLREAARWLRDEAGFNFLSDIAAADYLGWGEPRVAGYWGDPRGRDINNPGSWGLQEQPEPKPRRFSVSYHLLKVESRADEAPRLRLQVWCEDGESVPSVVSVWPTADWHEREAWDMLDPLRRPPQPRPDPAGGRLGGPPAPQGLPARR